VTGKPATRKPAARKSASQPSFPASTLATGAHLYRIIRRFDADGEVRSPWYFSSTGAHASGRFDLPAPRGTCYLSEARVGAFVEVFRRTRVIARSDVAARQIVTATRTGDPLRLANLRSSAAAARGVTLDTFGGDDYTEPQLLAAELADQGFAGVRAPARHDPTTRSNTVALFGRGGAARSQRGWRMRRSAVDADRALLEDARAYGYAVVDVPYDVPTVPPT
jgi:hypothetical protein